LIQSIESITTNARDTIRIKQISREQYVTQQAREAYLTSIYQFEASFDLSHAAQSIEISKNDINVLNKRL
jgi:hypothetical protein